MKTINQNKKGIIPSLKTLVYKAVHAMVGVLTLALVLTLSGVEGHAREGKIGFFIRVPDLETFKAEQNKAPDVVLPERGTSSLKDCTFGDGNVVQYESEHVVALTGTGIFIRILNVSVTDTLPVGLKLLSFSARNNFICDQLQTTASCECTAAGRDRWLPVIMNVDIP